MLQVQSRMRSIGAQFFPLTSLNAAAYFFKALAAFPVSVPSRARKVASWIGARMGVTINEGECAMLLRTADAMHGVRELCAALPPMDGMELITEHEQCVVCDSPLTTEVYRGTSRGEESLQHSAPKVYSTTGPVRATLRPKKCSNPACGALHYLSYATGGKRLPEATQQYYDGCTDSKWFHVTDEIVWESSLLRQYEVQAVCSHTGFETFMSEYSMRHDGREAAAVNEKTRLRLSHAFFGWTLLRWAAELAWPRLGPMPLSSIKGCDETLLKLTPSFSAAFTWKWGKEHAARCRQPGRCVAMAADGHMKARRSVCRNKWARVKEVQGLGKLVLNCPRTPSRGSYFCAPCREAAASADGPAGLVLAGGSEQVGAIDPTREAEAGAPSIITSGAPRSELRARAKTVHELMREAQKKELAAKHTSGGGGAEAGGEAETAAAEEAAWRKARGWKPPSVERQEETVHMLEDVLEHKQGQIGVLGEKHRRCVTGGPTGEARKKKMYKVRWLGVGSELDSWVCECDMGKAALEEYEAQRAERRPKKKVGALAAAWDAASDKCAESSGEFVTTARDEQSYQQVSCETLKQFQYAEKKHTTAGVLALVASCGLFLKIEEIFGSESMSQVYLFLYEAFYVQQVPTPRVLAYDDACHLSKFFINRLDTSAFAQWLVRKEHQGVEIYVDRFHFVNHKSFWCKLNVDPKLCTVPGFEKANTEAAEIAFAWLARSKHVLRHMNEARFLFFILRLAELRNRHLCDKGLPPEAPPELSPEERPAACSGD